VYGVILHIVCWVEGQVADMATCQQVTLPTQKVNLLPSQLAEWSTCWQSSQTLVARSADDCSWPLFNFNCISSTCLTLWTQFRHPQTFICCWRNDFIVVSWPFGELTSRRVDFCVGELACWRHDHEPFVVPQLLSSHYDHDHWRGLLKTNSSVTELLMNV